MRTSESNAPSFLEYVARRKAEAAATGAIPPGEPFPHVSSADVHLELDADKWHHNVPAMIFRAFPDDNEKHFTLNKGDSFQVALHEPGSLNHPLWTWRLTSSDAAMPRPTEKSGLSAIKTRGHSVDPARVFTFDTGKAPCALGKHRLEFGDTAGGRYAVNLEIVEPNAAGDAQTRG